ncbi:hypothetical protein I4O37_00485 [Enterobacter hormaechei]|uniref:hypothetical protein n=1 Tax=Enterobacter hormaechei TaxID=158836 RepID=UPI0018C3278E|nr:hypothetical protein [Enterobacter hormaechei]MBF9839905.1 hypothetical protein [Enterobacter hormaechei]
MECNASELVKRGHDQAAELKSSCGAVDVRGVAQLISDLATQLDVQLARSNALAGENAGLKTAIDATIGWQQSTDSENVESVRMLVDVKTPATDAFLAEVRAQGVERLANAWYAIANETDPGISISDSSRLKYRQRADDAADFANEIRQEAAQ